MENVFGHKSLHLLEANAILVRILGSMCCSKYNFSLHCSSQSILLLVAEAEHEIAYVYES